MTSAEGNFLFLLVGVNLDSGGGVCCVTVCSLGGVLGCLRGDRLVGVACDIGGVTRTTLSALEEIQGEVDLGVVSGGDSRPLRGERGRESEGGSNTHTHTLPYLLLSADLSSCMN